MLADSSRPCWRDRAHLQMFRPQKLPPIPYLLSNMIQPRKPRKFPEEERGILSEAALAQLPKNSEQRKAEVRGAC